MTSLDAFIETYLEETSVIARSVDQRALARAVTLLAEVRARGGRLFVLGVGGSAGNASHAVNDFRKIAGIEAYAPTDNVSELTAWTNDVGWEVVFQRWLVTSKISERDAVLVFSVGGGSPTTSKNLVLAMEHAAAVGCPIIAIVSRDGGRARELAQVPVLVPVVSVERITPHAEGWQAVLWHLVVGALGPPAEGGAPALFVDRDGTLNDLVQYVDADAPESPRAPGDLALIDGVGPVLASLRERGWRLFLVSNQPSAAKGKTTLEALGAVHQRLEEQLAAMGARFDGALYCHHHPDGVVTELAGACHCRKPSPGLLFAAAREHGIDLRRSWMVGDQDMDVECGRRAGCHTALIPNAGSAHKRGAAEPDLVADSLEDLLQLLPPPDADAPGEAP